MRLGRGRTLHGLTRTSILPAPKSEDGDWVGADRALHLSSGGDLLSASDGGVSRRHSGPSNLRAGIPRDDERGVPTRLPRRASCRDAVPHERPPHGSGWPRRVSDGRLQAGLRGRQVKRDDLQASTPTTLTIAATSARTQYAFSISRSQ